MFDLSGHTAVVTGGNGRIGLTRARGLAKSGADIAIWGRNPEKSAAAAGNSSQSHPWAQFTECLAKPVTPHPSPDCVP